MAIINADEPEMPAPAGDSECVSSTKPPCGLEEAHQVRRQRVRVRFRRQQFVEIGKALLASRVVRLQKDLASRLRRDLAARPNSQRHVHADRSGMKQVERPDIDGAAGQIGAARRRGEDRLLAHLRCELRKGLHPTIRPRLPVPCPP